MNMNVTTTGELFAFCIFLSYFIVMQTYSNFSTLMIMHTHAWSIRCIHLQQCTRQLMILVKGFNVFNLAASFCFAKGHLNSCIVTIYMKILWISCM